MFVRVQNNKEERLTYTVEVSFMEIYNETVKDLLNPKNNKKVSAKRH
jgi:kinesin family protein 1